jgi:hypothetical protein
MQTNKYDNILIIGSGNISDYIVFLAKKKRRNLTNISLTNMYKMSRQQKEELLTSDYSLIIYAGYDHYNFIKNIYAFIVTMNILNKHKYKGCFLFLNTQAILSRKLIKNKVSFYEHIFFERYSITKKLQSRLLQNAKFYHLDLYLPIVTGLNNGTSLFLDRLSQSNSLFFPNRGDNNFYILEIEDLCNLFFDHERIRQLQHYKSQCYFIYSQYLNIKEYFIKNGNKGSLLNLKQTPYQNIYNLGLFSTIRYVFISSLKNFISLFWHMLPFNNKTNRKKINNKITDNGPLKGLTVGQNVSFFRDFYPPEKIEKSKTVKIIKL